WQPAAYRHRCAKPVRAFGRRDTHPFSAVPPVQLSAFPALVAHPRENRSGRDDKRIRPRRGELAHSRPEHESPVTLAVEQFMDLEGDRQAVRRGPRQPSFLDQIAERARAGGHGIENGHRFVDDADAATMSHEAILSSQYTRCQAQKGGVAVGKTLAEKLWDS